MGEEYVVRNENRDLATDLVYSMPIMAFGLGYNSCARASGL